MMKVLEPIKRDQIPVIPAPRLRQDYEEIRQQALQLNGLALPVEFNNHKDAHRFAMACRFDRRKRDPGIRVAQRGNVVFVYKANGKRA